MHLKPDAHNLLSTALAAFREELLPVIPAEKRYMALMIASALAMAEREARLPAAEVGGLAAALYGDDGLSPEALEQRLAADIEDGAFDEPGMKRGSAFAAVKAINAARLAVTNPKVRPVG